MVANLVRKDESVGALCLPGLNGAIFITSFKASLPTQVKPSNLSVSTFLSSLVLSRMGFEAISGTPLLCKVVIDFSAILFAESSQILI